MAGDDIKRRSHHHRKRHAGSTVGRTRVKSRSHKDEKSSIIAPPAPPNLEELRKARLEYIERPREEKRSKMKYVWETPVPKEMTEDKERRKKSSTSLDRRKSEVLKRSKSTKPQRRHSDSEGEYVYGKSVEQSEEKRRKEASKSKSRVSIAPKATAKKSEVKKATESREPPKRRHTAPIRPASPCDDEESVIVLEEPTAPLRRRSTVTIESVRPPLKRSSTTTAAKTQVSLAKSATTTSPSKRRESGVFSSFLAARPPPPEKKVPCLTCGADDIAISRSARLPCKHRMCHTCLKRIFKMSITDPAHMPPRCCTDEHIDLKHVDKLFDQSFKKTWNRKYLEYKTKNRVYCIGKNCSEWIKPEHIKSEHGRKIGKCKQCGTKVCAICNNKAHTSRDCPKDPAMKQFIETAKQKGWQKCYNCSAMVELKEGCNHMTCRCTAEFCMVCGMKWKSCDCPWFNYENVDRHLGNPVRYQEEMDRRRDQQQRDEALARRMQALGVNDDNAHEQVFGVGNAAGHHMNQNFIQQAREALTANYQNAEQAARDLLNGWVTGRENRLPDFPMVEEETPEMLRQRNQRQSAPAVTRRRTHRRRSGIDDWFGGRSQTVEERDQEQRIQDWANGVADES